MNLLLAQKRVHYLEWGCTASWPSVNMNGEDRITCHLIDDPLATDDRQTIPGRNQWHFDLGVGLQNALAEGACLP